MTSLRGLPSAPNLNRDDSTDQGVKVRDDEKCPDLGMPWGRPNRFANGADIE